MIDFSIPLDYEIVEVIDNYYEGGCYKYDTVKWEIRIHNTKILEELNKKFHINFDLNKPNEINKKQAYAMHRYLSKKLKTIGLFGTRYLNEWY